MIEIFSEDRKFRTWRKLWIALAEAQKELGLNISEQQIEEMKKYKDDINYKDAEEKERELRHDVMAHIHAYGMQCPNAKPIIHLGATSAYVGDNTDIIIMKEALSLIRKKLINCIYTLSKFALDYKSVPTLGFTHFQPAQLTTIGKRACLWMQDLLMDLEELDFKLNNIKLLGVKGTTGTQASFLKLFDGNHDKVKKLDKLVAQKMGFEKTFAVSGQTYPRKFDSQILNILSGIAQSAHKFSNDIRLLQHLREIEEPFEETQVGSSAMAYKRNPMRSERLASLARFVIITALNPAITASNQWFERTLDDSANRRITIPEAFLATDAILNLYINIAKGLKVNKKVIEKHVNEELPFMATENILMEAVKRGGDRQELHERIRKYSMEASEKIKNGEKNNLLDNILNDKSFKLTEDDLKEILDTKKFIGRSTEQVDEFLQEYVLPLIDKNKELLDITVEIKV